MKIEMHFIIDEDGNWESGTDYATAVEKYKENFDPASGFIGAMHENVTRHVIQTMNITVGSAKVETAVPDEEAVTVE